MSIATDIGAYVGVVAFLGLALVVPLYFSQARDIRRLRIWMLLTPDVSVAEREAAEAARVAEEEAEAAEQAPEAPPEPARPPAPAVPPAPAAPPAGPDEPRPVPGLGPPTPAPEPTPASTTPPPPRPLTPPAGTTPPRPLTPAERIALDRPATQRLTAERTAVATPPTGIRRVLKVPSEGRLAAIVGAVLILGIAVVFVVLQTGGETTEEPRKERPSAVVPSEVEVAVLNGTAVPDLAARVGDDVEANGFLLGPVTNSETPFEVTTVLYEPGSEDEGQAVAKALGAVRTEPMDPDTRALVDDAPVAVVAGEDRAQ